MGNAYNFNGPVSKKLDLYAKWAKTKTTPTTYTVAFYDNAGTAVWQGKSVTAGNRLAKKDAPTPSAQQGKVFGGWYEKVGTEYAAITFDFSQPIMKDVHLYQKWSDALVEYTVTFHPENDTGNFSTSVKYNNRVKTPASPKKEHAEFEGWYQKSGDAPTYTAPKPLSLTYTGEFQNLIVPATAQGGTMHYAFGDANGPTGAFFSDYIGAVDAGTYYVWYGVEGDEDHLDTDIAYVIATIAKAGIAPVLTIEGWTAGDAPNVPMLTEGSNPGAADVIYQYAAKGSSAWSVTPPTAPGTYTVRALVPETLNYLSGRATADFTIKGVDYKVTAGNGSTWEKGGDEGLSFTFKRNAAGESQDTTFSHFVGIAVDGVLISREFYEAVEGSVVVTLKQAFLDTLSVGEHVITAIFDDGSASATFTVSDAQNPALMAIGAAGRTGAAGRPGIPNTGDATPMAACIALALLAAAAVCVCRLRIMRSSARRAE